MTVISSLRDFKAKYSKKYLASFFGICLLFSCGSKGEEEISKEGEYLLFEILQDLKGCHNYEDLKIKSGLLEKKFYRLAEILITLDRKCLKEMDSIERTGDLSLSDELRSELKRLYRLKGGQETLEKLQQKGLDLLDRHEKKRVH